jgi:hypothetical protein
MLSEIFWTFLCTSIIGCCLATSRMIYRSKCRSVDCCGIKIVRDVRVEEHLDEIARNTSMGSLPQNNNDLI